MKIQCPNPSCDQSLSGPKSAIGQRATCPHCRHSFIWTDRFYTGETFIIYDLETTGLCPDNDEFIQIAAVKFSSGCLCPTDSFFSFAKPRHRISSFIESYTGIGDRDVRDAPRPEQVLCRFATWSADATLIAHNAKRFDSKFLTATCQRHGLPSREVDAIDSIGISKMLFGKTRGTGHSLDHVKNRLRLQETTLRRHDARGDVDILGRAIEEMHRRLGLDNALNGVPRHSTRLPIV
ncbi:exonuclease domain-containing protein [Haloferula sp.]|uniref:exonuclease domain-containing protein n=1 Tax=Haloferula sp. TaxID=2497595 RepID=UPI003C79134F